MMHESFVNSLPVKNNFAWIFKYTLEVVTSPNGKVNFTKDVKSTPKRNLTLAAGDKDPVLSHVCFTVNVVGPSDTLAQVHICFASIETTVL